MDQPALEVRMLETVLGVYVKVQEAEERRSSARSKNRQRHQPTKMTEVSP